MSLSPMMQQYQATKEQYPDAILFYRLGDFYEMFFDDALTASRELELTLTGRDCGLEERAPMCGVPFHSADTYIARLVAKGYKVVICEQMENPKDLPKGQKLVRRDVVRIHTPGTVTESAMLNEEKNNYLCSVFSHKDEFAVCFADVSTGDIHVTSFSGNQPEYRLINELAIYTPSEFLFSCTAASIPAVTAYCRERLHAVVNDTRSELFQKEQAISTIRKYFQNDAQSLGLTTDAMTQALGALLSYMEETQKCEVSYVKKLNVYQDEKYMELDVNTRRNLELCETMRNKDKKGSLLSVLDRTKTAMGSRLLRKWIETPLRDVKEILSRQACITELFDDFMLREELGEALKNVLDIERLMARIIYQTANARDLRAILQTLQVVKPIHELLTQGENHPQMTALASRLHLLDDLIDLIDRAIVDEPPLTIKEGGIIKKGYHPTVDQLDEMIHNSKSFLDKMEAQEKEATGIRNLKIRYNRVFGYYIEITNSMLDQVPAHYIRKQTLTTGERFITQELKELEATILGATDKIMSLQYELFLDLRNRVANEVQKIQENGELLSLLDVYYSLASVAQHHNYTCPEVDISDVIYIKDGRHPVVEQFVQDKYFVPNDTDLNTDNRRLMLITGPNMAGKSTYMRQTALITLMAQIGSFVPAKEARIGVVDKLFTRVGASDDLASGQSTFMLEMNEVAYILKNATKQSLIIYDEIGRGTSTFDGMSIAQAVAEYTASKAIGAKTLFATHYHELTELEKTTKGVMNYHIAAKKKGDDIIFLRKIIAGAADDSYGIEVAKLAGVPNEVLHKAKSILANLIAQGTAALNRPLKEETEQTNEITFESLAQQELVKKIKETDINQLTPLEALNLVYEWKQKAQALS